MARIVIKYFRTESVTVSQRWINANMHETALSRDTVLRMHARFVQDENTEFIGGHGRPRVSDQNVEDLRFYLKTILA